MNDIRRVDGFESPADLTCETVYLRRWKRVHPSEESREALAIDPIHGNESSAANLTNIVNSDYVFVVNPGRQNEFSLKPQKVAQIGDQLGTYHLHRDYAIQ